MASAPAAPPALDARYKQHRCHARLADVVHTVMTLALTSTPRRAALLVACYAAAPGAEPTDAFLVDPAMHALRLRGSKAPARPAAAAAPTTTPTPTTPTPSA